MFREKKGSGVWPYVIALIIGGIVLFLIFSGILDPLASNQGMAIETALGQT